jgi:hypothetical protein
MSRVYIRDDSHFGLKRVLDDPGPNLSHMAGPDDGNSVH